MPWYRQLSLFKESLAASATPPLVAPRGRDAALEARARSLLRTFGAGTIANLVQVEWNSRMRTVAGRADFRHKLITLNPRLVPHGEAEIERTFLHELAHLLAQGRAGRRRLQPHGPEWRLACSELGIGDEQRCHSLPFPARRMRRRFLYRCPGCASDFPRVARIRRKVACIACCRSHNAGRYDTRFQLHLVQEQPAA